MRIRDAFAARTVPVSQKVRLKLILRSPLRLLLICSIARVRAGYHDRTLGWRRIVHGVVSLISARRLSVAASSAIAAIAGLQPIAGAQASRAREVQRAACAECTVSFQRVATIGGNDESRALMGQLRHIEVDGAGRYWVSFYGKSPPAIYSATGVFQRLVASPGEGPAELGDGSIALRLAADSMAVLDFRGKKMHVYNRDASLVRSSPCFVPAGGLQYLVAGTTTVVSGALRSRDQAGQPLHVFADTGQWIASFGTDAPIMRRNGSGVPILRIAGHSSGAFWAVDPIRYRLGLWGTRGEAIAELRRSAAWFRAEETLRYPSPDRPPQSQVAGIGEDGAGHLIVAVAVPDDRWRDSYGPPVRRPVPGPASQAPARKVTDYRKHFDSYIDVFDAASGVLLVSIRREEAFAYVLPGGLLVAAEADGETLAIHRVRVHKPQS